AQVEGVLVTIAMGRIFDSARLIAQDLDIQEPLICYEGAMVRHAASGEVLYHRTLPLDLTHEIISETERRGLHLNLYLYDRLYVNRMTPEARFYAQINLDLPIFEVGDLHSWLAAQGGATPTKLVIVTDAEET